MKRIRRSAHRKEATAGLSGGPHSAVLETERSNARGPKKPRGDLMEKRRVVIALAVMFLVGLAWAAQAFAADCGEPLSSPTYQVGDKWTWRNDKGVE